MLFFTDGDQDDNTSTALNQTRTSIQALAGMPQIQLVVVVGVNPEQCDRIRRELIPFGQRARILDSSMPGYELGAFLNEFFTTSKGDK